MKLTFGSLFTGIGGFDAGFEQAGMECLWQVEIDRECRLVLEAQFRNEKIERFNDITECGGEGSGRKRVLRRVDVICGGFPCQDLSVAGRRAGLAGERSGLWYEFLRVVTELLPSIVVIENVPGLLSSWSPVELPPFEIQPRDFDSESEAEEWQRSLARGWDVDEASDFETLLLGLQAVGYGIGWTVLDSQYFGVAQRRERVFVVAGLGDEVRSGRGGAPLAEFPGFRGLPAEILFESESLRWDSPPGRETGKGTAGDVAACLNSGGHEGGFRSEPGEHIVRTEAFGGNNCGGAIDVSTCLTHHGSRQDFDTETFIASERSEDGSRPHAVFLHCNKGRPDGRKSKHTAMVTVETEAIPTMATDGHSGSAIVAFKPSHYTRGKDGAPSEICPPLSADADKGDQEALVLAFKAGGQDGFKPDDLSPPLCASKGGGSGPATIAFSCKDDGRDVTDDLSPTLRSMPHEKSHANGGGQVAVTIPILEAGARTGRSTDDKNCGMGIGDDGDPMFTLQKGKQHAVAFQSRIARNGRGQPSEIAPCLGAQSGESGKGDSAPLVAMSFQERGRKDGRNLESQEDIAYALLNPGEGGRTQERQVLDTQSAVRRLTPRECARLQGFPDDWNAMLSDSARYKQFGNAVTVNVALWLGKRIVEVLGAALAP